MDLASSLSIADPPWQEVIPLRRTRQAVVQALAEDADGIVGLELSFAEKWGTGFCRFGCCDVHCANCVSWLLGPATHPGSGPFLEGSICCRYAHLGKKWRH
jgi:hypothetical protein